MKSIEKHQISERFFCGIVKAEDWSPLYPCNHPPFLVGSWNEYNDGTTTEIEDKFVIASFSNISYAQLFLGAYVKIKKKEAKINTTGK